MANSVLYVDFIDGMPKYNGYDFVMLVTCGFSRFTQAWPLSKKADGEQVLQLLVENWFMPLGGPKEVHSDCDVRFKSPTGFWRSVLGKCGIKVTLSTPYGKRKNPLCERQIRHFQEIMRVLLEDSKSRNWVKLCALTCWTMNRQIIGTTETTPQELFHCRPGWEISFPLPVPGNPDVESWVSWQKKQNQTATSLLQKIREKEQIRRNRRRVPGHLQDRRFCFGSI
jgi:Integrase core domain.